MDTRDEQGRSALHVAARNGQSSSVCALVELKSDTNATDKNGETPLHLAAKHGHSKSAQILIGADADLQIVSSIFKPKIRFLLYFDDNTGQFFV